MGGKYKAQMKKDIPGPGQYSIPTSTKASPEFGFGTAPKQIQKKDNSPGPGAYKIPSKIADVPRYALPNQSDDHKYI